MRIEERDQREIEIKTGQSKTEREREREEMSVTEDTVTVERIVETMPAYVQVPRLLGALCGTLTGCYLNGRP